MILFFANELDLFIKIKEIVILNNPAAWTADYIVLDINEPAKTATVGTDVDTTRLHVRVYRNKAVYESVSTGHAEETNESCIIFDHT